MTSLQLEINGMTCASCANRIEKKLNTLDGVEASVNYATEKASVVIPDDFDTDLLIKTIEATGYTAQLPPSPVATGSASRAPGDTDQGTGTNSDTEDTEDRELTALRHRLIGSVTLSVPVILMSMIPALQFTYWQWAALTLTSPVIVWAAWPFHRAAWINLRHGAATMDTLVSVGTSAAYLWSLYALFLGTAGHAGMTHGFSFAIERSDGAGNIYLEVAAGVTMFLLAGRYFEKRSKRQAGAALRALISLGAKDVEVMRPLEATDLIFPPTGTLTPISELRVGDYFTVRPGEKVASDGIIVTGTSAVDTSMLTGESIPEDVSPGDAVTGATVNVNGMLVVRATRVGNDTQLAQMARLVEEAQSGKANVQRLADQVSGIFVPIVIVIALGTLIAWLAFGASTATALTAAVAVLIIACPCALGLATPTALLVGTGRGAQLGILIRGPEVLESARGIDTIVLDKTGTVTSGKMTLAQVTPVSGVDQRKLLRISGGLEQASEHPIAQAIARGARDEVGDLPEVTEFTSRAGKGATGIVDGYAVVIGRPSLLAEWSVEIPDALGAAQAEQEAMGRTAVLVAWDGKARGMLAVADTVKPTSAKAIHQLKQLGLHPVLLTGDNTGAAHQVAAEVGIEHVIAEVLPAEKARVIAELQAEGRTVAMVGDGVNDAPALAQADLGLAMGTGTDAAIEASDLTLVRGDLTAAVDAIRLSRRTLTTIKGNLFWAFAYNVAAIPLAALGLLNPMLAGAAMAFSSVFVVANSLLLRRFRSSTN